MLVLSRKIGETICIGDRVELIVLDVHRGRIKLGFAGPRDISIRRGEHVPAGAQSAEAIGTVETCSFTKEAIGAGHAPLRSFRIASGV